MYATLLGRYLQCSGGVELVLPNDAMLSMTGCVVFAMPRGALFAILGGTMVVIPMVQY